LEESPRISKCNSSSNICFENKIVQNGNFSKQILQHLKLSLFGQQLLGASIFRFSYFEIFAAAKMLQKFKMTKYAASSDIMVATKEQ